MFGLHVFYVGFLQVDDWVFKYDEKSGKVGPAMGKVVGLDKDSRHQVSAQFLDSNKPTCMQFSNMRRAPAPGYKFFIKVNGKRTRHELVAYVEGGVKVKVWQSVAQRKAAGTWQLDSVCYRRFHSVRYR